MDGAVELEVCANCKKEIPHYNYVMHTAHCARNITLCSTCKEPFPKNQIEEHKKQCKPKSTASKIEVNGLRNVSTKTVVNPTKIEESVYFKERKAIEDKKAADRQARRFEKIQRFVDTGNELGHYGSTNQNDNRPSSMSRQSSLSNRQNSVKESTPPKDKQLKTPTERDSFTPKQAQPNVPLKPTVNFQDSANFYKSKPSLLPCKYCDLELPKLDLEDHENYCGARTDKCPECGELVMFKYRDIHKDSNHGFLKLNDEPGPKPTWESNGRSTQSQTSPGFRSRPARFNFETLYSPGYTTYTATNSPQATTKNEKLESSKEIARRLDCKTEYIRNLLHDSASITVPLRSNGAVPRNHFNHNKGGPAPQPPRRRNPPTELVIPCEFCNLPIPHEDLIEHETGCRPDLARFNPRRRSPSPDYVPYPAPGSPEADLPCEFCSDLIPASQLLRHQATCN